MIRRPAFTLIEVLLAVVLGFVLLDIVFRMLSSASRMLTGSVCTAQGAEAAIQLMDRMEEDLLSVVQAPGDPRPPAVAIDSTTLAFYRTSATASTPSTLVGEPATWCLTPSASGNFHPVMSGTILDEIELTGWKLAVFAPDREADRPGWYVAVEARFPTGALLRREHLSSRLIYLPQPSANFLGFLDFGHELLPGSVQLMAAPDRDERFARLGPPDPEQLLVPREGPLP